MTTLRRIDFLVPVSATIAGPVNPYAMSKACALVGRPCWCLDFRVWVACVRFKGVWGEGLKAQTALSVFFHVRYLILSPAVTIWGSSERDPPVSSSTTSQQWHVKDHAWPTGVTKPPGFEILDIRLPRWRTCRTPIQG